MTTTTIEYKGRAFTDDPEQYGGDEIRVAVEGPQCDWCGARDYLHVYDADQDEWSLDPVEEVKGDELYGMLGEALAEGIQGRTYRIHVGNCVDDIAETPWDEASARLLPLDDELAAAASAFQPVVQELRNPPTFAAFHDWQDALLACDRLRAALERKVEALRAEGAL